MVPGVDGELGQGDPQDPVGDGGDGEQVIGGSVVALDIYADLLTTFGPSGGHPQLMRVNPEGVWDRVSSSVEAFAAKRGTLIDITTQIDVTDAIRAALDILAIDGFGLILLTPGTGLISELIEWTSAYSNIKLLGAGMGVSTLKIAGGSDIDGMFLLGDALGGWDSGTTLTHVGFSGITLDGNKNGNAPSAPTALLAVRNTEQSDFVGVETVSFEGWGIRVYGSHINNSTENMWSRIRARSNVLGGGYWSDLKYNQFQAMIASNNNEGCGWKFGANATEFTQNVANALITHDNGVTGSASERAGVILDGVARFTINGLDSNANGDAGLSARYDSGIENKFVLNGAVFRRNSDSTGGDVVGMEIYNGSNVTVSGITVQGGNPAAGTNLDKIGILLDSCTDTEIDGANVTLINGRSFVATDCTGIYLEGSFEGNGQDSGSTLNHTVHLDNVDEAHLDVVCRSNLLTTGTDYEVYVDAGSTHVVFDGYTLDAASDGNEIGVEATVGGNQIICDPSNGYMRANTTTVTVVNDAGTGTVVLPYGYEMYIIDMNGADLNFVTPTRRQGTRIVIKVQASGNNVKNNVTGTGKVVFNSGADVTPITGQIITLISDGASWRSEQ